MEDLNMKKVLIGVLVLLVAVAALAYWQGWFNVNRQGVQVDAEKFKKDKEAFSKTVGEQAKAMKEKFAGLWEKSKGLAGDDRVHAEKELKDLETRHERLETQIRNLDDASEAKFEGVKQELTESLAEVDRKIEALTKKLEKSKEK
jgi:hypothetical protein